MVLLNLLPTQSRLASPPASSPPAGHSLPARLPPPHCPPDSRHPRLERLTSKGGWRKRWVVLEPRKGLLCYMQVCTGGWCRLSVRGHNSPLLFSLTLGPAPPSPGCPCLPAARRRPAPAHVLQPARSIGGGRPSGQAVKGRCAVLPYGPPVQASTAAFSGSKARACPLTIRKLTLHLLTCTAGTVVRGSDPLVFHIAGALAAGSGTPSIVTLRAHTASAKEAWLAQLRAAVASSAATEPEPAKPVAAAALHRASTGGSEEAEAGGAAAQGGVRRKISTAVFAEEPPAAAGEEEPGQEDVVADDPEAAAAAQLAAEEALLADIAAQAAQRGLRPGEQAVLQAALKVWVGGDLNGRNSWLGWLQWIRRIFAPCLPATVGNMSPRPPSPSIIQAIESYVRSARDRLLSQAHKTLSTCMLLGRREALDQALLAVVLPPGAPTPRADYDDM